MAGKRFGKSNTKVTCEDKNIPENVKTLEKHNGIGRWQHLRLEMRCKKLYKTRNSQFISTPIKMTMGACQAW